MTNTTEKAVAVFDLFPEELREPVVAYLLEQAEKFHVLRVTAWNFEEFLREARTSHIK
jgi:hypothetical protein